MLEPRDTAQGRGLAAARGPEQHHDLAGRHGKAYAVDRRPADRELLAQVSDVERRRHDLNIFLGATITAGSRKSCPNRQPRRRAASHSRRTWETKLLRLWDRSLQDRTAVPSAK